MSANQLVKVIGNVEVHAREKDNYVNATELCKLSGKLWADYARIKRTKTFFATISSDMGIPISQLVEVRKGNAKGSTSGDNQGTWVHPLVMVNFISWASPKFEVQITKWAFELMTTGKVELTSPPIPDHKPLDLAQLRTELREDLTADVLAAIAPIITELRALAAPQVHERWTTIPRQCQRFWTRPQRECGRTNGSTREGQVRHIHLDSREFKRLGGHASWPNSKSTWRQSP